MKTQFNSNTAFHIGLHVSDMKATVPFYRDLLGLEPDKIREDYAKFVLNDPALVITFNQHPEPMPSFGHLGFRVETEEKLQEVKGRLSGLGHSLREEQETSCCYALQNKFWVQDPDGYEWEVYYFIQDTEMKEADNGVCCSNS